MPVKYYWDHHSCEPLLYQLSFLLFQIYEVGLGQNRVVDDSVEAGIQGELVHGHCGGWFQDRLELCSVDDGSW